MVCGLIIIPLVCATLSHPRSATVRVGGDVGSALAFPQQCYDTLAAVIDVGQSTCRISIGKVGSGTDADTPTSSPQPGALSTTTLENKKGLKGTGEDVMVAIIDLYNVLSGVKESPLLLNHGGSRERRLLRRLVGPPSLSLRAAMYGAG